MEVPVLYIGMSAEISSPFEIKKKKKKASHDSAQIYLLYILLLTDLPMLVLRHLSRCTYLEFFKYSFYLI